MNARGLLLILCLLVMAQLGAAQTRKIGHRSHSGKSATFALLMDEDHLGRSPDMGPPYEVEPFVLRIRQHYEKIAKEGIVKKGNPATPDQPDQIQTADTSKQNLSPQTPSPDSPKSSEHPKVKKNHKEPQPTATTVPSPDFLVKARPKSKAAIAAKTGKQGSNSLWMLLGLLAFPVAPAIFFASAVMGRKRDDEPRA